MIKNIKTLGGLMRYVAALLKLVGFGEFAEAASKACQPLGRVKLALIVAALKDSQVNPRADADVDKDVLMPMLVASGITMPMEELVKVKGEIKSLESYFAGIDVESVSAWFMDTLGIDIKEAIPAGLYTAGAAMATVESTADTTVKVEGKITFADAIASCC